jgi:hypothetical protein
MTTQLWGGLGEAIFGRFWSRTFSLSFNIHLLSPLSRSVALREDIGLIRATFKCIISLMLRVVIAIPTAIGRSNLCNVFECFYNNKQTSFKSLYKVAFYNYFDNLVFGSGCAIVTAVTSRQFL